MSKCIAILDDERDMLEVVESLLVAEGFRVRKFANSDNFFDSLKNMIPDLIILDLMLPESNGYDICRRLKSDERHVHIPIIMFSAKDGEVDKVVGLELGADDYITKPFSGKELAARVNAVLRRYNNSTHTKKIIINDDLVIDAEKYKVVHNGRNLPLTSTEFRILELLASKRGVVFSRSRILDHLWGDEKAIVERVVDVHIKHLREKLGTSSTLIQSVRGLGYKIVE